MKKLLKTFGLVAAIFLFVLVLFNFQYFWKNLLYYIHKPDVVPSNFSFSATPTSTPQGPPNLLSVPSLKIQAPLVYIDQVGEQAFQAALKNGAVHFPGTALPGGAGNCYIFGHSSDFFWSNGKYKTVFATLPHIKKGAEISVSDQKGNVYIYVVTDTKVVSPNATEYLKQDYNKKVLTVQTSYPVGTALERFIAIAELK